MVLNFRSCKEDIFFYYKHSSQAAKNRIICTPDGGLEIVVGKKTTHEAYAWSKQRFCMLVEVVVHISVTDRRPRG